MFFDNVTQQKLQEIVKDYQYICTLITYQEVLADKKLYVKLLKDKQNIQDIAENFSDYLQIEKQLNELHTNTTFQSAQEQQLLQQEVENLNNQLLQKKQTVEKMLNQLNATLQNITVEIAYNSEVLSQTLCSDIAEAYKNFCAKSNFKFCIEENKNCVLLHVNGFDVKETFNAEIGIHLAVNNMQQACCNVFCYESSAEKFNFDEKDIKIDIFKSSGAGGQHINKTQSAVRVTHTPTGIVATCQDQRSQVQNKNTALENLKQKVNEFYIKQQKQHTEKQKKHQIALIKSGFVVRTYNYDSGIVKNKNSESSLSNFKNGTLN